MHRDGRGRAILVWGFVLVVVVLAISPAMSVKTPASDVSYSRLLSLISTVTEENPAQITIRENHWTLKLDGSEYETTAPLSEDLLRDLSHNKNVELLFLSPAKPSLLATLLISWIPSILIIILVFYLFRTFMAKTGPNKMNDFSRSKTKVIMPSEEGVRFSDVAGCDEAKSELEELVEFLKDPQRFTKMGSKLPKGVLLHGPPGTGKTLLAKAMAGEAQVPFLLTSGSDFVEMFVGVGAARVRDLFLQAKQMSPCVVFIDELDAIGKKRAGTGVGGNDEREQTLNQILVEMDGFNDNSGIIVLAATNRVDVLDKALTRPGRFDRKVPVPLPDSNGRLQILKVHTKKAPLSLTVNLKELAATTPGLSGADLANLINEAGILAAMKKSTLVEQEHVEQARDKVTIGKPRRSMRMSEDARRATAVHEAGHAILAYYLESADPLHKVTIIPHGQALGLTIQMPEDDRYSWNKKENIARIKVLLGGFIAEEMFLGDDGTSTGVSNDLMRAKQIAERMVKDYGMGEVGPVYFGRKDSTNHLPRETEASESQKAAFDDSVKELMRLALLEARDLLRRKREHIAVLTCALMDKETIMAAELDEMFGVLE